MRRARGSAPLERERRGSAAWAGAEAQRDEDDAAVRAHGQSKAWATAVAKCPSWKQRAARLVKLRAPHPV